MTGSVEDPGWGPATKGLLFSLVPTLGARRLRRDSTLVVMRMLWCSFVGAMAMVAVVVLVLTLVGGFEGVLDGRTAAVVVVVTGVPAQLLAGRLVGPAAGDDPATAVARVQRAFFLRVALAELPALVGFVGFVLSANPAVYLVGLVISAAGLLDAAPTARRIDAQQQELRDGGSSVELLPALLEGQVSR